ncbi:cob(I)yrinic acid a,c-diamide adenosyltransferase [Candidatus Soleaferrea massiliensis]|uniref:cob(I)yrinic acid a,c-diamide adenosyltransferase n=1 Tax=Candidatus Soleaferrea massiliensis TaxID=1470354 RepID=UPI00058E0925|nr:cob(I)yrinic acid a,c-diamide adenosyltransferase [Candidatus Soleaferrea massiliensis]
MKNSGLVHIYTGDGKGKTTAAVGLAVRARGAGLRVLFIQFLKSRPTSEQLPLQTLGIEVLRPTSCPKFFFEMDEKQKERCVREQQDALCAARQAMLEGRCDLIVLDEVLDAVSLGCLDETRLIEMLHNRASGVEVVLTGRGLSDRLGGFADYLSVISAKKHPYEKNMPARLGIEY